MIYSNAKSGQVKPATLYPILVNISSIIVLYQAHHQQSLSNDSLLRYHLQDIDWQYVIYRLIALYEKIEMMLFISKNVTYYIKIVRIMMQKLYK